jgi:hypothetical protein
MNANGKRYIVDSNTGLVYLNTDRSAKDQDVKETDRSEGGGDRTALEKALEYKAGCD